MHGLKKADPIDAFEKEIFDWPEKISLHPPPDKTDVGPDLELEQPNGVAAQVEADEREGEDEVIGVTMSGRVAGIKY